MIIVSIPGLPLFYEEGATEKVLEKYLFYGIKWTITKSGGVSFALGRFKLLGGKGGFGANLKANGKKTQGSSSSSSADLQRDSRSGLMVRDLRRMRQLQNSLQNCDEEGRKKLEAKRKKLERAIEYYERELRSDGKGDSIDVEETENLMEELQKTLDVAMKDSEDETDKEKEEEEETEVETEVETEAEVDENTVNEFEYETTTTKNDEREEETEEETEVETEVETEIEIETTEEENNSNKKQKKQDVQQQKKDKQMINAQEKNSQTIECIEKKKHRTEETHNTYNSKDLSRPRFADFFD